MRTEIALVLEALGFPNGEEDITEIEDLAWDGITEEDLENLILNR